MSSFSWAHPVTDRGVPDESARVPMERCVHGDATAGWALGLQVGRLCGLRYDNAVVPHTRALDDVRPAGFTFFVHPLEIVDAGRLSVPRGWHQDPERTSDSTRDRSHAASRLVLDGQIGPLRARSLRSFHVETP
jgi:hypothetical protein